MPVKRSAALAAAVLAAVAAGCAGPAEVPRHADGLGPDELSSSLGEAAVEPTACGFETHRARTVRPGEVLTREVVLGTGARVVAGGCRRGDDGGEIAVTVTAGDGRRLESAWRLDGESGWWTHDLDLAELAGERVEIALEARLDGPRRLFLRELRVEHRTPVRPRRERPPQVLLISIDTLRHDALGAYGGAAETPALDRLAARGERFTAHRAGASWTKPSHAELLTGYGAAVHGVIGGSDSISPVVPTLAERFREAGFATGGLVHDCVWLRPKFGFGRGFESYRAVDWGAEAMARAASGWMIDHRERPFFYFLHVFEPHSDYSILPYEGRGVTPETVHRRFGVDGYGCRSGACASTLLMRINDGSLAPLPGEDEILRFLYDRGVERVDRALGRLFDDLEAAGLADDLLIAVTSDHGEAFLEHGVVTHGWEWEEVLRVPLIVRWPGGERAGTVNEAPSGAEDLAATLLAAAGVPAEGLGGSDLRTRRRDRPVFAGSDDRVVIDGSIKAVFELGGRPPRLYDLAADPGEQHDLAAERPGEVERLRGLLDARSAADRRRLARLTAEAGRRGDGPHEGGGDRPELTDEERARLRALGYLDGG